MSYGKIVATGLAFLALAWLESIAGEKQRNWEEKYKDYQDEIDRLNNELEDTINFNNYEMDFKELIDLHYQSFSTADNTKKLLDDARDSLKAIGQTIMKLKENKKEIELKLKNKNFNSSKQELEEELISIIETRKKLFKIQDKLKEQRNTLSNKLKEFNQNTQKLKFKIRDNTGRRGREWFEKLERKKENRTFKSNSNIESGCFLSTACINHMNLDDDCFELEILRYFRDTFVISLDNGNELIFEYYENAPKILFEISKSEKKDDILEYIYKSIIKIVEYIELEDNQMAFDNYKKMYQRLKQLYLKS